MDDVNLKTILDNLRILERDKKPNTICMSDITYRIIHSYINTIPVAEKHPDTEHYDPSYLFIYGMRIEIDNSLEKNCVKYIFKGE